MREKTIVRLEGKLERVKKAMLQDPDWKPYARYLAYYENRIARLKGGM